MSVSRTTTFISACVLLALILLGAAIGGATRGLETAGAVAGPVDATEAPRLASPRVSDAIAAGEDRTAFQSGASREPSVVVEVAAVSSLDLSPVSSAAIDFPGMSAAPLVAQGASTGLLEVSLPLDVNSEGVVAIVSAPGFAERAVALAPTAGAYVVALTPMADLAVEVLDEFGQPAAGVAVSLLPSVADGPTWTADWRGFQPAAFGVGAAELRRRTEAVEGRRPSPSRFGLSSDPADAVAATIDAYDGRSFPAFVRDALPADGWTRVTEADGLARWRVPAGQGYRWGIRDAAVISYEPPTRYVAAPRADGRLVFRTDAPAEDVSGPFDLAPGAARVLRGEVARSTGVVGALPFARPASGRSVVVQLFHRASPERARVRGYESLEVERSMLASAEGAFSMVGVRPGHKVLRAWWREAGDRIHFAQRSFELERGVYHDLGAIAASPGATLEVRLPVVENGRDVEGADVLEPTAGHQLVLTVIGRGDAGGPFPELEANVGASIGGTLGLVGLPFGDVTLSVGWAPDADERPAGGGRFVLPPDRSVDTAREVGVELPVELERLREQSIAARFPVDVEPVRCRAILVGRTTGRRASIDLDAELGGDGVEGTVELVPDVYQVAVHSQDLGRSDDRRSWYAAVDVALGQGVPLAIDLLPAASFDGLAVDRDGAPLERDLLFFEPIGSFGRPGERWTHVAETDSAGRFRLTGLVPRATYRSSDGLRLVAGAAGEIDAGTLRVR